MKKEIKKLQELFCWNEFYKKNLLTEEQKICSEQIENHKKKYNL